MTHCNLLSALAKIYAPCMPQDAPACLLERGLANDFEHFECERVTLVAFQTPYFDNLLMPIMIRPILFCLTKNISMTCKVLL